MTFFRHFPSKEDVVLGMPPDSAGIVVAEHVLTGANKSLQPFEIARIVLDAVVEELGTDGLSDIALRLSIVHENPTLLKALYARIPQWIRVVDALLANLLRTAHDDAFSMHLKASAMVMYWVEPCANGLAVEVPKQTVHSYRQLLERRMRQLPL